MPAPRPLARVLLAVLVLGPACAEDREGPDAKPSAQGRDPAAEMSASVEGFAAAPTWNELVGLLRQGHAEARAHLGPHRLRYTAKLETGPAGLGPSEPLPPAEVERPILERFELTDTLELTWGSKPGEPVRLALDQSNEHEHSRGLVILDERVFANLDGRGWLERPLETDIWQLWADDAQHAVLDLVELAGPHADIDAVEAIEVEGRPALRVSLRASEQQHPDRVVEAPTPWRRGAVVELGTASVILDRATGLWLGAQIELRWRFEDREGRDLVGRARFDGRVEALAEAPTITPPADAQPTPERDRPQLLRERMLGGLAGP